MDRGYIKLWRKSLDTAIFNNPNAWLFWCYCLMKASHKDRVVLHGNQSIPLKPGQFIFGRKKASHETGLSEQNIRTCVKILDSLEYLTIKPTNKYSIISIVNWDTYQPDTEKVNQQTNQEVTSKQPTDNHKQECITLENNPPYSPPVEINQNFNNTAEKIYAQYCAEINPKSKSKKRAIKNIITWLKRDRTETDLISAYKSYKKTMSSDPQYRKNPANFYGINEDFAFDYLPVNQEAPEEPKEETQEDIQAEIAEALS